MKEVYNFIAKPLETHLVSYYVDFPVFDEPLYFEFLINPKSVTIRDSEYSYKPTPNIHAIREEMSRLGEAANRELKQRIHSFSDVPVAPEITSYTPPKLPDVASDSHNHDDPSSYPPRSDRYSIRKKFASILVDRERSLTQKRYSNVDSRTPVESRPSQATQEIYVPKNDVQDVETTRNNPPTIDDLLRSNDSKPEKSNTIINPEDELEERQELLGKFAKLRMKYSNMESLAISIPDFSIRSDLQKMRVTYSSVSRLLKTQKTIADYKKYLTYVFIAVEFVFGHWLGFNMDGYLASQKDSMSSYDSLLMELSEKYNKEKKSKVPVELRLVGMMGLNIFMFIVANNLMSGQFGILGNIMGGILKGGMKNTPSVPKSSPQAGMKMRKPTVTLDKIRESAESISS